MIKKALLSVSILSAVVLGGCDNTAKVPEAKQDAQAGWLGKWLLKKAG